MNHDIFISYSSKQKSIADGVCHYLEENGFKCWMAPRDILVGSDYGDLIEDAIKTCKVVVLVFSQSASISKWVKGEINVAFTEDKPILPFRVDETEIKGGFRVMLNQMHWIDAFPQYADRLPDLLNSVCGFLGRQPQKVSNDRERLETERKAKEAAEKARKEQEAKDNANSLIGGLGFGSGSGAGNGTGNGGGGDDSNTSGGKPGGGKTGGGSGGGGGKNRDSRIKGLDGRWPRDGKLPEPECTTNQPCVVAVKIRIDKNGNVLVASSANATGTTTADVNLIHCIEEMLKKVEWNEGTGDGEGVITYHFVQKTQ